MSPNIDIIYDYKISLLLSKPEIQRMSINQLIRLWHENYQNPNTARKWHCWLSNVIYMPNQRIFYTFKVCVIFFPTNFHILHHFQAYSFSRPFNHRGHHKSTLLDNHPQMSKINQRRLIINFFFSFPIPSAHEIPTQTRTDNSRSVDLRFSNVYPRVILYTLVYFPSCSHRRSPRFPSARPLDNPSTLNSRRPRAFRALSMQSHPRRFRRLVSNVTERRLFLIHLIDLLYLSFSLATSLPRDTRAD